jgi:hypothetical protein
MSEHYVVASLTCKAQWWLELLWWVAQCHINSQKYALVVMAFEFIVGPLGCTDEVNLIQLMWTEWNHVSCTCSICLLYYQYVCAIQANSIHIQICTFQDWYVVAFIVSYGIYTCILLEGSNILMLYVYNKFVTVKRGYTHIPCLLKLIIPFLTAMNILR